MRRHISMSNIKFYYSYNPFRDPRAVTYVSHKRTHVSTKRHGEVSRTLTFRVTSYYI